MAGGAVAVARRNQVVGRRRHTAQAPALGRRLKIGMALQAEQEDFLTDQHPGIYRAVRLVARCTAIGLKRSVFEDEGPSFVAVTIHASGLRARTGLTQIAAHEARMGIVAGGAGHSAFGHLVMMRFHERRGRGRMATSAKLVDSGVVLQTDKGTLRAGLVHVVAGRAGNGASRVTALYPSYVG